MRRLAKAHRQAPNYHIHRHARLGSRRSAAMTLGITCHCRGRAGAAATRTRFSRRLRLSAFKCWLSERSVPSELESFEAICPASGASSYLEALICAWPLFVIKSCQLYRTRRRGPNPIIRYTWVLQKYRVGGTPPALRTSSLAWRRNWLTASSISSCPGPLLGNDMN